MNFPVTFEDKKLLGQFLGNDPASWAAWKTFSRVFFGLPPGGPDDMELFTKCTGRTKWPSSPSREAWIVAGRRSGKSFFMSLLATRACRRCLPSSRQRTAFRRFARRGRGGAFVHTGSRPPSRRGRYIQYADEKTRSTFIEVGCWTKEVIADANLAGTLSGVNSSQTGGR
jgi:hypothetical protein